MADVNNGGGQQLKQTGDVLIGPGGKKAKQKYSLPKLTSSQERAVSKAKKYAMEQNIKAVLVQQTIAQQQQMQKQQAASMMNRSLEQIWTKLGTIYVGSINFDINEETVKQAFLPFGPMKNVSLGYDHLANKHKGYAFIEYEIPEAAFLAIEQMNNVMLGGRNIKVGRPSNMPQCQPVIERLIVEAQKYYRVYVTSIHPDLNEQDLRSVFEAFGKVVSIQMFPDVFRPGKHRGYAFIEYDNPQSVIEAVANMNLFDLGGQYLRVGKAVTPPNVPQMMQTPATPMPTAAAVAAAAVTAKINAMDVVLQTGVGSPGVTAAISAAAVAAPVPGVVIPRLSAPMVAAPQIVIPTVAAAPILPKKTKSRVMVLRNMVGAEDLDEELEAEVTEECAKYGEVDKVVIYQERQSADDNAEIEVKIFVQFATTVATDKAIQSLHNRYFGGRRVQAITYDELMFERGDLSG